MINKFTRFWTLDRVIELFIIAVAIAAFSHSQWSFSTQFQGLEPAPAQTGDWLAWWLPGALMALALDIGQIATSRAIKTGHRSAAMFITFVTFSAVTYYLQFLFIIHHAPAMPLSSGVSEKWVAASQWISDASIWLLPAALPLITFLYTISYKAAEKSAAATGGIPQSIDQRPPLSVMDSQPDAALPALPVNQAQAALPDGAAMTAGIPQSYDQASQPDSVQADDRRYTFTCAACGYHNTYTSPSGAAQGQRAHNRHCQGRAALLITDDQPVEVAAR